VGVKHLFSVYPEIPKIYPIAKEKNSCSIVHFAVILNT